MRLRIGMDAVEIARIEQSLKHTGFLRRFFGERERAWLESKGIPAQSVAACFCAKEAFAKALGTGVRGFALQEVELLRDSLGAPYFHFTGNALELVQASGLTFAVSVTHTKEQAMAFVVATGQTIQND